MIDWEGEELSSAESGVSRIEVLTPGKGFTTPNDGARVESNSNLTGLW